MSLPSSVQLQLPDWLQQWPLPQVVTDPAQRMQLVLDLAHENIRQQSGGPFAAAIFEQDSGKLIAAACNQVVPSHCSLAHAETLVIALAQQALQTFSLRTGTRYQLVSSAEPCAMCTGAIAWSGISSLVYGAVKEDVEAIGFLEGAKPAHWQQHLQEQGIQVEQPLLAQAAKDVLLHYHQQQGQIYNGNERQS